MTEFEKRGSEIKVLAKSLVIDLMSATPACWPGGEGLKQAQIFRDCGFDWGNHENATSSHQQYWLVAILRELESEGRVERLADTLHWRLVKNYT